MFLNYKMEIIILPTPRGSCGIFHFCTDMDEGEVFRKHLFEGKCVTLKEKGINPLSHVHRFV